MCVLILKCYCYAWNLICDQTFFWNTFFLNIKEKIKTYLEKKITLPPWSLLSWKLDSAMFLRPVRWASQQLPHGLTASRPHGSCDLQPAQVLRQRSKAAFGRICLGAQATRPEFPSVWVWDVSRSVSGSVSGSLGNDPKVRRYALGSREMVSDHWDSPWRFGEMSLFGVCLFSLTKTGPLAQGGQRGMQTPRRWTSQQGESEGGQGRIVMSWESCHCQVEMFQGPLRAEGCWEVFQSRILPASPDRAWPVSFFLRKNIQFEETFENSVDTLCFSQLRMLEDQYLLALLVLPRKFLWTDLFFWEWRTPRYHGYHFFFKMNMSMFATTCNCCHPSHGFHLHRPLA